MNTKSTASIKIVNLDLRSLELHPVWTWCDGSLFEDEDFVRPVTELNIGTSSLDVLFVLCDFETVEGMRFKGSIAYECANNDVYAITFWHQDKCYCFNRQAGGLVRPVVARLTHEFPDILTVLPVRYHVVPVWTGIQGGVFDVDPNT